MKSSYYYNCYDCKFRTLMFERFARHVKKEDHRASPRVEDRSKSRMSKERHDKLMYDYIQEKIKRLTETNAGHFK